MTAIDIDDQSRMGAWLLAARPRTLPAAVAPVLVGTAMAIADKHFAWLPATAAFVVALLLQIGVNLANDYFDYVKGIDTQDRLGPPRVTQSGLIPAKQVKTGMLVVIILSVIPGLYLAGGGAHPGAGVPMAALSGRNAAAAILGIPISPSTFRRTATRGGMSTGSATTPPAPSASSGS